MSKLILLLSIAIASAHAATIIVDDFSDGSTTNGAPMVLAGSAQVAGKRFLGAGATTLQQSGLTNVWAGHRNIWLHQGQMTVTGGTLTLTKPSATEGELFYTVEDPSTASSATGVNLSSLTITAGAISTGPVSLLVQVGNLTSEGVSTASGTLASSGTFTKNAGDFAGDANLADVEWIRVIIKSGGTSVVLNGITIDTP